jgi:2-hydroxy-3-keto-5-methylthiopentenyl-1-phosphate phosphatase
MSSARYRGIVSSDWSECLSPNGPFDPLWFVYPHLKPDLSDIFSQYTGNVVSLDEAVRRIKALLPSLPTQEQMDAYLDACFQTYKHVPELIQWCLDRDILFMINTTGTHGYFQRALAKGLLPAVPIVSANPMLRFDEGDRLYEIREIDDKPRNTQAVMKLWNVPAAKLVVIGDSGGDGPHFLWAAQAGGYLIGSMIKASLVTYCRSRGVEINRFFGLTYEHGRSCNPEEEMRVDFMELADVIEHALGLHD